MNIHRKLPALLAALGIAAVPVAIAQGATKRHTTKRQTNSSTSTSSTDSSAHRAAEKPLTGDTKTQAEKAALDANPGATVRGSSAEDPAENSGAAYEVHIVKSDGSAAEVLKDSSFAVLSTKAEQGHRGHGGHGGHGGPGGGNPNEAALTGDTKTQAEQAALDAVPGGTVRGSSSEDPAESTGAAYEVHVTKAEGSEVEVLEDSSFKVLSTAAGRGGPRH